MFTETNYNANYNILDMRSAILIHVMIFLLHNTAGQERLIDEPVVGVAEKHGEVISGEIKPGDTTT